jgi:hypothetical protein
MRLRYQMIIDSALEIDGIDRVLKQSGQVRGGVLRSDANYIKNHYGDQALGSVEAVTTMVGYPIDYNRINTMAWYPACLRGI